MSGKPVQANLQRLGRGFSGGMQLSSGLGGRPFRKAPGDLLREARNPLTRFMARSGHDHPPLRRGNWVLR